MNTPFKNANWTLKFKSWIFQLYWGYLQMKWASHGSSLGPRAQQFHLSIQTSDEKAPNVLPTTSHVPKLWRSRTVDCFLMPHSPRYWGGTLVGRQNCRSFWSKKRHYKTSNNHQNSYAHNQKIHLRNHSSAPPLKFPVRKIPKTGCETKWFRLCNNKMWRSTMLLHLPPPI